MSICCRLIGPTYHSLPQQVPHISLGRSFCVSQANNVYEQSLLTLAHMGEVDPMVDTRKNTEASTTIASLSVHVGTVTVRYVLFIFQCNTIQFSS